MFWDAVSYVQFGGELPTLFMDATEICWEFFLKKNLADLGYSKSNMTI